MTQPQRTPQPPFVEVDPAMPVGLWRDRFGAPPDAFEGFRFWKRSNSTLWIAPHQVEPPEGVNPESIGLSFLRLRSAFPKPTTTAVRRFGHLATRNVIDLDHEHAMEFMRRGRFPMALPDNCDQGYILAHHGDLWLGCGLWLEGHLSSQIARQHALHDIPPMTRI